ncbi:MAG: hypothetical protein ACRDD7_00535 [Peptostreptococcaceae bacterium]
MKKYIVLIAIIIIGLIGISIFDMNLSRKYHHRICKTTNLSEENIDGIYLGEKINDNKVESKYGKISEFSHDNILYDYYFLSKEIEIATEKNDKKIIRFVVNDKNIKSKKGIKIGDTKDKIIEVYGENFYKRLEQGTNIIGYVDKQKNISIEFWLDENEKVVFYKLDYKYVV